MAHTEISTYWQTYKILWNHSTVHNCWQISRPRMHHGIINILLKAGADNSSCESVFNKILSCCWCLLCSRTLVLFKFVIVLITGHHNQIKSPITNIEQKKEEGKQVGGSSVQIHLKQVQIHLNMESLTQATTLHQFTSALDWHFDFCCLDFLPRLLHSPPSNTSEDWKCESYLGFNLTSENKLFFFCKEIHQERFLQA